MDIIVGGPPCQGFSVAGPYKFGILDDRNNLVQEYLRFVSVINPNICVLENVKNIMNGKLKSKQSVIEHVLEHFDKLEYNVKIYTLLLLTLGCPQSRTSFHYCNKEKIKKLSFLK
ncbi:MAG: DNA cytosine methyltransferase [Saprospiraceae bacterium]|nr:DNA cytosine methyltransferase [Saprospiraceae bacterium]